jgi:hypothetical protein
MFENSVPNNILQPKRDKITGKWRRLHNEELYDPHSSTNTYYSGD